MRRLLSATGLVLLSVSAALAQNAGASSAKPGEYSSFDLTAIDKSVDLCQDFYHYACGNWLKNNPILPDQSSWGRFNELHERNDDNRRVHSALEHPSVVVDTSSVRESDFADLRLTRNAFAVPVRLGPTEWFRAFVDALSQHVVL